jgi:hypothetical protein
VERSPWEHRLGRTLRVFLLLLAASGLYRIVVVPLVEPLQTAAEGALEPTAEEAAAIRARAESRMAAIGEMFPAGAWERDSPIVLESQEVRLLFKHYHSLPDGRVNLVPCTLVLLPEKRADGEGRTIVMRSPQGAVLEFAEPLDLRQGRLSKLVGGSLRGQITVRGTETVAGAEDDLEIVSRDLQLRGMELRSTEAVQFRYGRSTGSGQGLAITLLPKAGGPGRGSRRTNAAGGESALGGPNIGGIDSVRLEREVRLLLAGIGGDMVPATPAAAAAAAGADPGSAADRVRVRSAGPMTFHPNAGIVLLEDRVEVVREQAASGDATGGTTAATDELSCDALTLALGGTASDDQAAAGRPGGMAVREIEARGAPAVARSRSAGLEVRADRIGYQVSSRRILLDGGQRVSLSARGLDMEAAAIDYVPGDAVGGAGGAGGVAGPGTLLAAGPGWIRTAKGLPEDAAATRDSAVGREREAGGYAVRFSEWLRARPDGEGYVASVTGDAVVTVEGQGSLAAAEIHLWMEADSAGSTSGHGGVSRTPGADGGVSRSPDADGGLSRSPLRAPQGGPGLTGLRPARLLARGEVAVDNPQLAARTDRIELWFRHDAPAVPPGQAAPSGPPPRAAPGGPPARPLEAAARGRFLVSSGLVRGLVVVRGEQQDLEEMSLEGQVHLLEQPSEPTDGQPISIRGDQMQVTRPARSDARAVVSGSPARVVGRDLELDGPLVEFDRGRNRVAVDGAGRLLLPVPAGGGLDQIGFSASPRNAAPAVAGTDRLTVEWSGRMEFDGLTARFVDRVVASGGAATVRATTVDVLFDRRLDLTGTGRTPQSPQVARVNCAGGVRVDTSSRPEGAERSVERLAIRDLSIDRVSGEIIGNGPGRLTSVRLGPPPGPALTEGLPGQTGGRSARDPTARIAGAAGSVGPRGDELSFLGVDFQRGMRGNLHSRLMEFHQRVEAIWGPVADWTDSLDLHAPGGLPPRAVAITSEMLSVAQGQPLPSTAGGGDRPTALELAAAGNVLVEGETFTARSARLSWSEAQDLLVFEGDGRADAQLFRQTTVGGPTSSASAGRILYWRSLNRIDVNDARYLDLDQLNAGSGSMRPPTPPAAGAGRSAAAPPPVGPR